MTTPLQRTKAASARKQASTLCGSYDAARVSSELRYSELSADQRASIDLEMRKGKVLSDANLNLICDALVPLHTVISASGVKPADHPRGHRVAPDPDDSQGDTLKHNTDRASDLLSADLLGLRLASLKAHRTRSHGRPRGR